jgi:hypothetical protein
MFVLLGLLRLLFRLRKIAGGAGRDNSVPQNFLAFTLPERCAWSDTLVTRFNPSSSRERQSFFA